MLHRRVPVAVVEAAHDSDLPVIVVTVTIVTLVILVIIVILVVIIVLIIVMIVIMIVVIIVMIIVRGGEGTDDRDTVASNYSTGNCLSSFDQRISSKSPNREI